MLGYCSMYTSGLSWTIEESENGQWDDRLKDSALLVKATHYTVRQKNY